MTTCHAGCMAQVSIQVDDRLAANAQRAAASEGLDLAEWVLNAIRRDLQLTTAMRARAEEDARGSLYTREQEEVLMDERQRRGIAAFDRQ
jgi:hypothetical protein